MSRRTERVGDLVRGELAMLLSRRVHDPRVKLASISTVDVSPDLKHAIVTVSVLGDDTAREQCLVALRHARGFLRTELARGLRHLKAVPELVFELDRSAEYSQQMSDLLEKLHHEHDESA